MSVPALLVGGAVVGATVWLAKGQSTPAQTAAMPPAPPSQPQEVPDASGPPPGAATFLVAPGTDPWAQTGSNSSGAAQLSEPFRGVITDGTAAVSDDGAIRTSAIVPDNNPAGAAAIEQDGLGARVVPLTGQPGGTSPQGSFTRTSTDGLAPPDDGAGPLANARTLYGSEAGLTKIDRARALTTLGPQLGQIW